jgi:hypothetical protein
MEVKMATKKVLLTTDIKRAKGKLYFCGTSEDGKVTVVVTDMAHKEKLIPKKEEKKKE